MEMSKIKALSPGSDDVIKTKPLYEKKTFFWELQAIETVMTDGVQKAVFCEFDVGTTSFGTIRSKWKLSLDIVDDEPALWVQRISPKDNTIYYKLSAHVMKSKHEETDIISYPNAKIFYESSDPGSSNIEIKFTLHRQLAYGCNYATWFKDVLVDGSLLLKVAFETCESISM